MDWEEYNSILARLIYTLIRFKLIDENDEGYHYQLHAQLFNLHEHLMIREER